MSNRDKLIRLFGMAIGAVSVPVIPDEEIDKIMDMKISELQKEIAESFDGTTNETTLGNIVDQLFKELSELREDQVEEA